MKLEDFAFMPRKPLAKGKDYVDYVADFAITEPWGSDGRYLERYIDYNFEMAHAQGRIVEAPDKSYALWRVGNLTTRDNEPISVLCTRNRKEGKQPYYFVRVFNTRRIEIQTDDAKVSVRAPDGPSYTVPTYDPSYEMVYQFSHYLEDNRPRAEGKLPGLTDNQRFLCIYAAAMLAHRRGSQAAVPQWYRDKHADIGGYQWLLPLHINADDLSKKPDLVATLEPDDENREYRVRTLLPAEWAYPNARAVSTRDPQFRMWA